MTSVLQKKIPDHTKKKIIYKTGDNIYKPLPNGGSQQLRSMHSDGKNEKPKTKAHDLGGVNILVGTRFHYFGSSGPELPLNLEDLKVGRRTRVVFLKRPVPISWNSSRLIHWVLMHRQPNGRLVMIRGVRNNDEADSQQEGV